MAPVGKVSINVVALTVGSVCSIDVGDSVLVTVGSGVLVSTIIEASISDTTVAELCLIIVGVNAGDEGPSVSI